MQKALVVVIIVLFLGIGSLSAQSFSVSNDSVTGSSDGRHPEYVLKTYITNLQTTKPLVLKWERFENNYANGWAGNQICVDSVCYYYTVDTGSMHIPAASTESLDAHFGNESLQGNGSMRIRLYDPADSAGTQKTVYFGASLNNVVGITPMSNSSTVDFQIFPNPAKEYVIVKRPELSKVSRIEVYNMLGLKVITQQPDPNDLSNRIDLMDLQKGVYMIRIFDKNNNVILTKSISKIR